MSEDENELEDVTERFLASFYGAFDVRFIAEEFISSIAGRVTGMGEANHIRVLTVDDHPLMREGIATTIKDIASADREPRSPRSFPGASPTGPSYLERSTEKAPGVVMEPPMSSPYNS